ncbi:MAG TPA: response regulator transcription factor [Coleofasciculaceae cyanobacterium]
MPLCGLTVVDCGGAIDMKRILVVDDDPNLCVALARYLEKQGYSVQTVDSGAVALACFQQNPVDLVVADVVMPEMDGFELCRQLRSLRIGQLVPFIFLSGRRDLKDRIHGHSIGGDDYVIKPFNPGELLAKINGQLERSRRMHSELIRLLQQVGSQQIEGIGGGIPGAKSRPLPLTPAEERVFWEVVQGYTNKQIGERLFISPRTVQTHLSNILTKLELDNRSQLVRYAFEQGHTPPQTPAHST